MPRMSKVAALGLMVCLAGCAAPASGARPRVADIDDDMELLQVMVTKNVQAVPAPGSPGKDAASVVHGSRNASEDSRRTLLGSVEAVFRGRHPVAVAPAPGMSVAGDFRVVWVTTVALIAVLFKVKRREAAAKPSRPLPGAELEAFAPKAHARREKLEREEEGETEEEDDEAPPCPAPGTAPDATKAPQTAKVPLPSRRLRHIGASFVIPHERIRSCTADVFTFDIPMLPCVWPLHAVLSRSACEGRWERIELTVDIIKASGLPPLLSCGLPEATSPARCEGTGGTGCPEGAVLPEAARDGSCGGSVGGFRHQRLEIRSGGGAVAASITIYRDGSAVAHRQDNSTWDLEVHLDGGKPSMTVLRNGREICQATSLGSGNEEYLQVDTQPDTQSPESAVLLMCLLAILTFGLD